MKNKTKTIFIILIASFLLVSLIYGIGYIKKQDFISPLGTGDVKVANLQAESDNAETTSENIDTLVKLSNEEIDNLVKSEPIYRVDNFSDYYYGKVQTENNDETFNKGWVAIYDKKSNAELIKVYSEELVLNLHDGKVKANIMELPYGEQSLINYEDYNFDGIKDLSIMDGQNSCYHLPSFKVYLADNKTFTLSEEFTKLAQDYCGMFMVDDQEKIIYTMKKSGCCWHEYSKFIVESNLPKVVFVETVENAAGENSDLVITTTKKLINGEWKETKSEIKETKSG